MYRLGELLCVKYMMQVGLCRTFSIQPSKPELARLHDLHFVLRQNTVSVWPSTEMEYRTCLQLEHVLMGLRKESGEL